MPTSPANRKEQAPEPSSSRRLRVFAETSNRAPIPLTSSYFGRDQFAAICVANRIDLVDSLNDAQLQLSVYERWGQNQHNLPRPRVVLLEGEPPQPDITYKAYKLSGFGAIMTPANGVVFSGNHFAFYSPEIKRSKAIKYNPRIAQLATFRALPGNDPRDNNFMVGMINGVERYRHRVLCTLRAQVGLALKSAVPELIDIYGRGWPTAAKVREDSRGLKNESGYRSWEDRKWAILKHYGFNLCWENMDIPGYVSEKFWDNLRACTLPLYWGPPRFHDLLPPGSIVDCRQYLAPDGQYDVGELLYSVSNIGEEEYIRRMTALYDWFETLPSDGAQLAFADTTQRICDQLWRVWRAADESTVGL